MKNFPSIKLESLRIPAGMQAVIDTAKKGSLKVNALAAVAGTGIELVSATRDERGFWSEIADEYRPEIAQRLGVAVDQVTQEHYQMAFAENPVLAQAKQVSQMGAGVRAANMIISTTVGVLAGIGASVLSRPKPGHGGEDKGSGPANIAGGVAATFSAAAVGKLTRKLMHTNRLGKAMEGTAHYKIMQIKEKQQRGEETTPADIFEVQLALNPEAAQAIKQTTGKDFAALDAAQKQQVLSTEFPDIMQVNAVMAERINKDGMRPQQLVFGEVRAVEQDFPMAAGHPDLPPNAAGLPVEKMPVEASGAEEATQALLAQLQQQQNVEAPAETEPARVSGFAAREQMRREQQVETSAQR